MCVLAITMNDILSGIEPLPWMKNADTKEYKKTARERAAQTVLDFTSACEWIESEDMTAPYSFMLCCEALGFEHTIVRNVLIEAATSPNPAVREAVLKMVRNLRKSICDGYLREGEAPVALPLEAAA